MYLGLSALSWDFLIIVNINFFILAVVATVGLRDHLIQPQWRLKAKLKMIQ
jgi:hypothetical protein